MVQLDKDKRNVIRSMLLLLAVFVLIFVSVWMFYIRSYSGEDGLRRSLFYAGLILVIFAGFTYFMFTNSVEVLSSVRKSAAMSLIMIISFLLMTALCLVPNFSYMVPYSLCAILGAMLIESKTMFFSNICLLLLFFAGQLLFGTLGNSALYYILFSGIFCCVLSAYSTVAHSSRGKYVVLGLILGLCSTLIAAICYFMFSTYETYTFIMCIVSSFLSGILTIVLLFLFIPIFEVIFNLVTDFRLGELTSTNQPLLQKLFKEAPGTFNHSLVVSNYAEACATAIGANPYMARAAAYYHDIGKMKNPMYFVENLGEEHNPHEELTPEASVLAIKKHVMYGYALAKEYHLPEEISRAIIEHHGTLPIKFFYLKAKKLTDGDLSYENYRYDGPTPSTKISAILMIVDACEAALRASGNKKNAAQIVQSIIEERMNFNQFIDCDITMKDMETIKQTILSTYLGVKHERIVYPDVKLDSEDE